jgi:hypothetical protein
VCTDLYLKLFTADMTQNKSFLNCQNLSLPFKILFKVGIPFKLNFIQLTNGRIASQRIVKIMPKKSHFNYNFPFTYIKLNILKTRQIARGVVHSLVLQNSCFKCILLIRLDNGMVNTSIANHLKVNNFFSLLDDLEIIPASYLGGSRFKSWPKDLLSWLRLSMVLLKL